MAILKIFIYKTTAKNGRILLQSKMSEKLTSGCISLKINILEKNSSMNLISQLHIFVHCSIFTVYKYFPDHFLNIFHSYTIIFIKESK